MTTITSAHDKSRDDSGPQWLGWLVVGFLGLNILLLAAALLLWRYRQPEGTVMAEGGGSPPASSAEVVTEEGQMPAPMTAVTGLQEDSSARMSEASASETGAQGSPSLIKAGMVVEDGVIDGQVSLQGQSVHAGITILLDSTPAATTDDQGAFRIAAVPAGTHTVTAHYPGYIPRQAEFVQVQGEETITLPAVSLRGGDTDNDGDVDIYDIVRYASNRSAEPSRRSLDGAAPLADSYIDANGDGVIDVRDVIVLQGNLGTVGPEPWEAGK